MRRWLRGDHPLVPNHPALVSTIASAVVSPALAQSIINRRIETVAIVPSVSGGHDVHVIWTLEAGGTSVGLDASMGLALFVGAGAEVPVASTPIDIQLDVVSGFCGIEGCAGGCGGGYIDGVFNTMLCLQDGPCGGGGCGCDCRFPSFLWSIPGVDLDEGDELVVVLFALPGTVPENEEEDDAIAIVVPDRPLFWDQSIAAVDVTPSGSAPGEVKVVVEGAAQWRLPGTPADLSVEVQLFVGSTLIATDILDGFAHPPGPGGSDCDGSPSICSNGCGSYNFDPVQCELEFTYPSYLLACECGTPWITTFLAVPATPGEQITVLLLPAASALPTLPGSTGDDTFVVAVPGACIGDLNGDGAIDGADLGVLLGGWGDGGAGDLDGNGTTDGGDLGLLLGNWGVCAPV